MPSSKEINCLIFTNSDILKNFLENTKKNSYAQIQQKQEGSFFFELKKWGEKGEPVLCLYTQQDEGLIRSYYKVLDDTYSFDSTINIFFYGFHKPEIQYAYYFSSTPDDISCIYPLGNNNVTILRGVKKGSLFSDSFYQKNQEGLKEDYLTFTKTKKKINYIPPYAFSKRKTHQFIILESIIKTILIKQIQKKIQPIKVAIVCPLNQLSFVEEIIQQEMDDSNNLVAIKLMIKENGLIITIFYNEINVLVERKMTKDKNLMNVDWSILGCDLEILIFDEEQYDDIDLILDKVELRREQTIRHVQEPIDRLRQLQVSYNMTQQLPQGALLSIRQQLPQEQQLFKQQKGSSQEKLQESDDDLQANEQPLLHILQESDDDLQTNDQRLRRILQKSFKKSELLDQLKMVLAFLFVFSRFINFFLILYNSKGKPTMQNYFEISYYDEIKRERQNLSYKDVAFDEIVTIMDNIRRIKKHPNHEIHNIIWFKNLKFYTYIIDKTDIDRRTLKLLFGREFINYPMTDMNNKIINRFRDSLGDNIDNSYFKEILPQDMFYKTQHRTVKTKEFKDNLGDSIKIPESQDRGQEIPREDPNDFDYYFISSRSQSKKTFKTIFPLVKKVIVLPCEKENVVNLFQSALSTDFTMDWSFYNDNSCPENSNMIEEVMKIIFYKKLEKEKLQAALKSDLSSFYISLSMQKLDFCEEVMKDILKFSNDYPFQSSNISNFLEFLIPKIVNTNVDVKKKHDKEAYIYINLFILQELIKKTGDEIFSKFLEESLTHLFQKSKDSSKRYQGIEGEIIQDAIQPYISEQKTIKLKNLLNNAENISGLFKNTKLPFEEEIINNHKLWLRRLIDEIEEYKPEEILPLEPLTEVSRLFPELVNKYILKAVIDILNTNFHKYIQNSGEKIKQIQFPYDIMMDNLFYKILGVEENADIDEVTPAYDNRIEENEQKKQVLASVRDLLLGRLNLRQQRNELSDNLTSSRLLTIQQGQQQHQLLKELRRDKLLYKVLGIEEKENEPSIGDTHTNRIEKAYENRIKEINEQSRVFHEVYQFLNVSQNKQLYDENYRGQRQQNDNDNPNDPGYKE